MGWRWIRGLFATVVLVAILQSCSLLRSVELDHRGKEIQWSGMTWFVKEAGHVQGPGPNYFSASDDQVWVDEEGRLHLTIKKIGNRWYCSEVIAEKPLGYGLYRLQLASPVDDLDPAAVLGFFTWNPRSVLHNNEIDIELSRWGDPDGPNGQYVIQPYYYRGHLHRFNFEQTGDFSTHEFVWMPLSVLFRSYHGHELPARDQMEINKWRYSSFRVPRPKNTHVRINFWLNNSSGLRNKTQLEVVISNFSFIPPEEF